MERGRPRVELTPGWSLLPDTCRVIHNPRMPDARSEALEWLTTFEAACRGQDFAAGRRLFAADAVAFGPDGQPFTRHGRATFNLARRDGRWLAVHSHVSLLPPQSESAHGRR